MKVLLADDHSVVRKGLLQIINEMPEVSVIDEVTNGIDVIEKVNEKKYDLLVLDISMPGKNGLDVLKDLKISNPKLHVLILSTYPEELFALRSFKAGAAGYLNKNSAPNELAKAILKVAQGGKYISAKFTESLATYIGEGSDKLPHERLSDRELEVFRLFAEGKTSTQIANNLNLSQKTISTHKSNILSKMNLNGSAEMALYAIKNNLIF